MNSTFEFETVDLQSVAEQMALYAEEELLVTGAAVVNLVSVTNKQRGEVRIKAGEYVTRLSRQPEPENPKRGPDDKGTDYLAYARAKAAKRLRLELGIDTQDPPVRRGEVEVRGDSAEVLVDALWLITAYSGAPTPEQDQLVTQWGVRRFRELAVANVWKAFGDHVKANTAQQP